MNQEQFIALMKTLGIEINDTQMNKLNNFYKVLIEWNSFMNLTGITEYEEVLIKHFADSLIINKAIAEYQKDIQKCDNSLNLYNNISLLDLGTGAGFPGMPLKIVFPKLNVKLVDSLNKRINFLNEVINQLKLKDISAIHARAEELAKNQDYREKMDVVVSRAVANLSSLSEYCIPFVKQNGYFIAYKSGEIDNELNEAKKAIEILGGKIVYVYKFNIPETDIERSFIFIKKIKKTANKFPRKAGLPTKEPLK